MKTRFETINPYLKEKILDVGFSVGPLNSNIRCLFPKTVSIDLIIKKSNSMVVKGDAQKMPFKTAEFNSILAGELIEHLSSPEKFVAECKRLLKKGGNLIITTPNRKSLINRIFKAYYKPAHLVLFTKKELLGLLESNGFKIEKYTLLPYTEDSSEGSTYKWFYSVRKIIHHTVPNQLREEMIVVAKAE